MTKREPKFKVGDVVTFRNDYGVVFLDKIVTGIEYWECEPRYYISPTDSPWCPVFEKNLSFPL